MCSLIIASAMGGTTSHATRSRISLAAAINSCVSSPPAAGCARCTACAAAGATAEAIRCAMLPRAGVPPAGGWAVCIRGVGVGAGATCPWACTEAVSGTRAAEEGPAGRAAGAVAVAAPVGTFHALAVGAAVGCAVGARLAAAAGWAAGLATCCGALGAVCARCAWGTAGACGWRLVPKAGVTVPAKGPPLGAGRVCAGACGAWGRALAGCAAGKPVGAICAACAWVCACGV